MTANVVKDVENLLTQVRERSAALSEQNKRSAGEYVIDVRDSLKQQIYMGVQKANQIVLDNIRDVENELTSFSLVIDDAVDSFVEEAESSVTNIRDKVSKADSGNVTQVLDTALRNVDDEMKALLVNVDEMFSFYGGYISLIVDHFVKNATDRISVMLNSHRRNCDCSIINRINMCYNISSQNENVTKNLKSVVNVINIVQDATDTVTELESVYADAEKHSYSSLGESKNLLLKTMDDSKRTLDVILDNDYCFLGSTVRRFAYEDHATLNEFMIRSMKTVIQSLAKNLHSLLDTFQIVKPVQHHNRLVSDIEEKLETLVNEAKSKARFIADVTQRAEYERRANMDEMKKQLKTKFANVTDVVNNLFDENRNQLSDSLKYNLAYIVGRQLPYISTMTIQNYIPFDICPTSIDYQQYISSTIRKLIDESDDDIITDLFNAANYFGDDTETGVALATVDDDSSTLPSDDHREDGKINEKTGGKLQMYTELMLSILSAIGVF